MQNLPLAGAQGIHTPPHTFIFIGGLHRSGTSLLFELLREHPRISGFRDTGANHDEGQHLQSVYPPASTHGRPGRFGFDAAAHLTEDSPLVTGVNRAKLFGEWARHWDTSRPFLLEKSPPNLIRARFLQAMFSDSKFVVLTRHPVPVSLATRRWSRTSLYSLLRHWIACLDIWESDKPFIKHYLELPYERLVESPRETLDRVCEFLGVDPLERFSLTPDPSVNERYFAAWAALRRQRVLGLYLTFLERAFEARIRRWGYSFAGQPGAASAAPKLAAEPSTIRITPTPGGDCLILAGMHRSGTSMVAQAFARAGLYLGDTLQGPSAFNAEGYFEDLDIVRLHDAVLGSNRTAWHVPDGPRQLTVSAALCAEAGALLRRKFADHSPWGWKDPRTTLLLDFWKDSLPAAKWVLLFRDPAHVTWSLMGRGDLRVYSLNRFHHALIGLRLWTRYNRKLLGFARSHRERTLLVRVPDDVAPLGEARINEVIAKRWAYPLRPLAFNDVYAPILLKRTAPGWIEVLARLYFPARRVFRQLTQVRDELLREHLGGAGIAREAAARPHGSKPVLCIITPRKAVYSETFIQAHIRRLPAHVKVLHGGYLPLFTDDDRQLVSLGRRAIGLILERGLGVQQTRFQTAALRRYLRRQRVDAVLAEFGPTGAEVWEVCRDVGVPLIVHFHGGDATNQRSLRRYRDAYERMFAAAAAIIAVSRQTEQRLAILGAPREKLVYNPCGADTALFAPGDPAAAPPRFLAINRLVDKKAPHVTLLAFKRLVEACPEARLSVIGDGPLLETCQQLARALHLTEAVTFLGPRSHAEVAAAMQGTRAVVLHSMTTSDDDVEGTPVTVLEAGAAGLPVVSTRHGGITDVVLDGETGFLVDEGDADAMARHLITLARDPGLAAKMGRQARERVSAHFSLDRSLATLWAVIDNAIRASREGSHADPGGPR